MGAGRAQTFAAQRVMVELSGDLKAADVVEIDLLMSIRCAT